MLHFLRKLWRRWRHGPWNPIVWDEHCYGGYIVTWVIGYRHWWTGEIKDVLACDGWDDIKNRREVE